MATGPDLVTWSRASSALAPILLDAGIKGFVLLAAALLLTSAMRRASASLRHFVWLLAAAGLLVLPVLSGVLPEWRALPSRIDAAGAWGAPAASPSPRGLAAPMAPPAVARPAATDELPTRAGEVEAAPLAEAPSPAAEIAAPAARPRFLDRPRDVAVAAWALGVLLALLPQALGRLSLWRLARGAERVAEGPWALLLKEMAAGLRLRRSVVLLRSGRRSMPMAWGLLRPKLLLPAEAESWPEERLRVVVLHELAHIRRHDCLALLLSDLACAVHWFNPLAWVARGRMVCERERACDDAVLAAGMRPSEYADHILRVASGLRAPWPGRAAAIAMARPSKLEGRLLAVLDGRRSRRRMTTLAAAASVVLLACVLLPLAALQAKEAAAKEAEGAPAAPATPGEPLAVPRGAGVESDAAKASAPPPTLRARSVFRAEVITCTVNDDNPDVGGFLIDLDTARVLSPPKDRKLEGKSLLKWLAEEGVDAVGDTKPSVKGLMGFDMVAIPLDPKRWDSISPKEVKEELALCSPGTPVLITGKGELPAAYIFKTREGGMGVLRITGFTEKPAGVNLEIKLIREAAEKVPVAKSPAAEVRLFSGTLEPRSQFRCAPGVAGRLKKLLVNIGDHVKKDQVIAQIDDQEYALQHQQARGELELAEVSKLEAHANMDFTHRELENLKALRASSRASESEAGAAEMRYLASQSKFKAASLQVFQKEAALVSAELRLKATQVRASWEGKGPDEERVVVERLADEGALLAADAPIVSLIDISALVAVIRVNEDEYTRIKVGQGAVVMAPAWPGKTFKATVVRIAPFLDRETHRGRVELEVPNPGYVLKPGMSVRVVLEYGR